MDEIADYLTAGTPLIKITSTEYPQVERKIFQAFRSSMKEEQAVVGVWKINKGLLTGTIRKSVYEFPKFSPSAQHRELVDALSFVSQSEEPTLVVFHNLKHLWDTHLVQNLIDATLQAKTKGSHIVIVGPYFEFPDEVRNLVVDVPFELPSEDEIAELYTVMTAQLGRQLRLPDGKPWFKPSGKAVGGRPQEDLKWRTDQKTKVIREAAKAACGMDLFAAETALALSMTRTGKVDIKQISEHKKKEVGKSDVIQFISREEDLSTIGGMDALKDWLKYRERAFTQEARDYGLTYPKGILLVGPTGTGKSLAAKAIGAFLNVDTLRLDGSKLFRAYVGESEGVLNTAITVAEAMSPVNLWLDEIEKIFASHRGSGDKDAGVTSHLLQTILTWRQECRKPVMLVATANAIEGLPPELTRKGRFDEIWLTGFPTQNERQAIFSIHINKRKRNPENYDLEKLAARSKGFTGAEIESAIESAMYRSFFEEREFNSKDILREIKELRPQINRDGSEMTKILEWAGSRARKVSSQCDDEVDTGESGKVRKLRVKGVEDNE